MTLLNGNGKSLLAIFFFIGDEKKAEMLHKYTVTKKGVLKVFCFSFLQILVNREHFTSFPVTLLLG